MNIFENKFDRNDKVLNTGFTAGLVLLLIIYFIFPFVAAWLEIFKDDNSSALLMGLALIPPTLIILVIVAIVCRAGEPGGLRQKLQLVNWKNEYVWVAAITCLGLLVIVALVSVNYQRALDALYINYEQPPLLKIAMKCDYSTLAVLAFGAIVLAPVSEEIVFRRFIFGFTAARAGVMPAMVTTSLAFALIHYSILQLPGLFLLGMAFQLLYLHFRSLYPAILLHAFNNLAAFTAIIAIKYYEIPLG